MACRAREANQGQMQAFINQQLCHYRSSVLSRLFMRPEG
jgi:hypothetical protein